MQLLLSLGHGTSLALMGPMHLVEQIGSRDETHPPIKRVQSFIVHHEANHHLGHTIKRDVPISTAYFRVVLLLVMWQWLSMLIPWLILQQLHMIYFNCSHVLSCVVDLVHKPSF